VILRLPSVLALLIGLGRAVAAPTVGFLTAGGPLGAEDQAARDLAAARGATVLTVRGAGTPDFGACRVLWLHRGDSAELSGPLFEAGAIAALKSWVSAGHGLLLSGAALALVRELGIEPAAIRTFGHGDDGAAAQMVPTQPDHPIFRGLDHDLIDLSDRGYPASADFYGGGGPAGGMLLGRTPSDAENPLVEYRLGAGRVIVMGWRLPHYGYRANPHRAELERLTANILDYLGDPKLWRPVVVAPFKLPPPGRGGYQPTIEAQLAALGRAIADLRSTYGPRYPQGEAFAARLAALQTAREGGADVTKGFEELRRAALLANPLLDFDRLLVIKRSLGRLGLPQNWESDSSLPPTGYDNEIDLLNLAPEPALTTVYRPAGGRFVGDLDLHWDGRRLLFSMPGANGRWQIHQMTLDGASPAEIPTITQPDVDNYDACWLPDGNLLFTSTATFTGVPCVTGASHVSNLYLRRPDGAVRRLTFEQDHDWCPTVMNDGRVMYLRWEYSDIPHFTSRILFHMNPDGADQGQFYGGNSYWPNAMFFARPVPGEATKFFAIVGGHHDVPRMGELVLFDAARGRHEAEGAVQRLPGWGKPVEPKILDGLVGGSWPKFLHPRPLNDKYVLVAAQLGPNDPWGIYLADVFDNLLPLKIEPGYALLQPIPLKATPQPPAVPETADPTRRDAAVYMADVYAGGGLAGVPRGTVKALRLFTYQFAYHNMGGQVNRVGLDGPWDVKRIVGTVPVQPDGSAYFSIPANTPIAVQPLDEQGQALQLMRSWMTAMPGETLSCVGCHEGRNVSVPRQATLAAGRPADAIRPWYGPTRGFSFRREVQPVLDAACVSCHDGQGARPDFTERPDVHLAARDAGYNNGAHFPPSYLALRAYVRAATIESDAHLLSPLEYHFGTTRLAKLLRRGHHGVRLEAEAWDRLITWFDLNTPAHGTWHEIVGEALVNHQRDRRLAMNALYGGPTDDPEAIGPKAVLAAAPPSPDETAPTAVATVPGWPFDAAEARRRQAALGEPSQSVDLGGGQSLDLVRLPGGTFVMGDAAGRADERPPTAVTVGPLAVGRCEITNAQFACFDPSHDSRIERGDFLQFSSVERGYPVNGPDQPVCRVSWAQAMAFCDWLSARTGRRFRLPTEAEWEWACRAGSDAAMWYGPRDTDFSTYANLADRHLRAMPTYGWGLPSGAIPPWRPAIETVDDGYRVSAPVGRFAANPWGLRDMAGNVWQWTLSTYRPYPYRADDGRNDRDPAARKVVRGGSWYDRPQDARSAARDHYPGWQRVYDVGFRVVAEG
jgi:formylglycine-generating enzyme required for sulfatase activity